MTHNICKQRQNEILTSVTLNDSASRDILVGVGVSDLLKEINGGSSKDLTKVLIGDGMIIFAQIIVAAQMVIEEKFVNGKNIHPLR